MKRRVGPEKQAGTQIRTGSCLGMGPRVAAKVENKVTGKRGREVVLETGVASVQTLHERVRLEVYKRREGGVIDAPAHPSGK